MTIDLRASTDFEVLRAAKVLARIDETAREAGVTYLVVGATARSLISTGPRGTSPERRTKDVDIATEVESWDAFAGLVRNLERHGRHEHEFIVEEPRSTCCPTAASSRRTGPSGDRTTTS